MREYWFYGIVHDETVSEEDLTEQQKVTIKKEHEKLTKKNLYDNWLGCFINEQWVFKRNGFEIITIDDHRGNIARAKLLEILSEKFQF